MSRTTHSMMARSIENQSEKRRNGGVPLELGRSRTRRLRLGVPDGRMVQPPVPHAGSGHFQAAVTERNDMYFVPPHEIPPQVPCPLFCQRYAPVTSKSRDRIPGEIALFRCARSIYLYLTRGTHVRVTECHLENTPAWYNCHTQRTTRMDIRLLHPTPSALEQFGKIANVAIFPASRHP